MDETILPDRVLEVGFNEDVPALVLVTCLLVGLVSVDGAAMAKASTVAKIFKYKNY